MHSQSLTPSSHRSRSAVRTMLEAIISFMPSEGMGAIGALDWTVEERKKLAVEVCAVFCKTSEQFLLFCLITT